MTTRHSVQKYGFTLTAGLFAAGFLVVLASLSGCQTLSGIASPLSQSAIRPVVAVSSFENRSGFSGEWQLGSGMADLLVSELVLSKNFVIVERQHLDQVVGEISRQKDDMFRSEGKVEARRLKSAQYLIRGEINDFSQVSGGALSVIVSKILFGGRGCNARVALTLSIVDVESGEILNSVQCAGTARAREAYVAGSYKGVAFGGDAFFRTPLGVATRDAIRRGVRGIVDSMPLRPWRPMIAEVDGATIMLNGGTDRGYREGDIYVIREPARAVTDPATGDVLTMVAGAEVGRVRVIRAEPRIAVAEVVKGGGFKRGQCVTRQKE